MQVLDLAFNNMTDKVAIQLVAIIKDQAEQRDTMKWKKSLRKGEGHDRKLSAKSASKGMTEFIFHHNLLGKRFIEALSENIPNDIYVRKIDVSNNKIPEQPILSILIDALRINESLVNLDISGNPGCTSIVKQ